MFTDMNDVNHWQMPPSELARQCLVYPVPCVVFYYYYKNCVKMKERVRHLPGYCP